MMNQVGIKKSATGIKFSTPYGSHQNQDNSNSNLLRSLQQPIKIKTQGTNGQKRIIKKYYMLSFI